VKEDLSIKVPRVVLYGAGMEGKGRGSRVVDEAV
jgi:hypothetical protein